MPIDTDAFTAIIGTSSPVFSRDGTRLFHLRGAGLPQVWSMDLEGGNAHQLSFHDEKVAFLRRAPKDDRLFWGIDAGGDECTQFWMLEPSGVPQALTAAPEVMHEPGAISPDGTRFSFAANDRDPAIFDIKVMDIASGAQERLMQGPGIVRCPSWRPDGAAITVVYDHSTSDQRLSILELASGEARAIPAEGPTRYAGVRWAQGRLCGLTDAGGSDFMRLCRIDEQTGAVEVIHAAPGRDVEAWAFSADSGLLATIENDRGYAVLRVGPMGGERPAVAGLPEGVIADLAFSPDGTALAFSVQGPAEPSGIWLWQGGAVRAVWRAETGGLPPFIAPELVSWTSFDGLQVPGFYATPAGRAPAAGWPAVVWVHGGPSGQTRANFRPDIQMLLNQGYAVLMPNIRGSTGYGRAYMEADEIELRPHCLDDLAAGRAWLAARPEIDAGRIGIMGQSYGGWVVLAAVTLQPELWRAAVNYYGIADFVTLLEKTGPWRRDHRAREYGFPGEHDALFDRISPLRHVHNVVAPLLLLHGDRDPRVPMNESEIFTAAMEERQKKVRYERFSYAGHGFIRPDHRRRVYAAVAEHFGEYL